MDYIEGYFEGDNISRKGFDYGMAWYMHTMQLDKFSRRLGGLSEYGYRKIPRHYEEAVLMWKFITGKEIDAQFVHFFWIENGKVIKFQQYADTHQVNAAMR